MNAQMSLALAVALIGFVAYFTVPKAQALAGYAWLAGLLVFLLSVSGKGVTCTM